MPNLCLGIYDIILAESDYLTQSLLGKFTTAISLEDGALQGGAGPVLEPLLRESSGIILLSN
jgi:hypothetical protein